MNERKKYTKTLTPEEYILYNYISPKEYCIYTYFALKVYTKELITNDKPPNGEDKFTHSTPHPRTTFAWQYGRLQITVGNLVQKQLGVS